MVLSQNERIFDTLVDTANFYVSVNHYFTIRKFGKECAVYLFISGNKQRERISTEIKAPTLLWDEKKARFKEVNQKMIDYNLILGQLEGKIEGIKVNYRLTERILTPEILKEELLQAEVITTEQGKIMRFPNLDVPDVWEVFNNDGEMRKGNMYECLTKVKL